MAGAALMRCRRRHMCFQDLLGRGVDLLEQNLISPEIGDLPQNVRSVTDLEELSIDHSVTHYELATACEVHIDDLDVGDFSRRLRTLAARLRLRSR